MSDYDIKLCKLYNSIGVEEYIPNENIPIYHYTSPDGFIGVVENSTLRFTDRYYLNDASEGRFVMEFCVDNADNILPIDDKFKNEFVKQCKERFENPQVDNFYTYQCSFSTSKDSLCLWNYYTKGDNIQGYNLEFLSTDLCEKLKLTAPPTSDGRVPKIRSGYVVYDPEKQKSIVKQVIDKFYQFSVDDSHHKHLNFTISLLIDKLMFIGMFFKKKCFSIEEEYRIVIDLFIQRGKFLTIEEPRRFMVKNSMFIPYVDISFEETALTGVTISPTLDFNLTRQSVIGTLQDKFQKIIKNDAITKSEIPVRY